MQKNILLIVLILIGLVSTIGAAETFGNPDASIQILIATESTPYKTSLVVTLIEKLDNGTVGITVVDHQRGELEAYSPLDFSAVFITNSGAQARVRPNVAEWLEAYRLNDANILLHTTQRTVWTPDVEVDSITSASRRNNIDEVTDDIIERLRRLF